MQAEPLAATDRRWRVRLAHQPVDRENRLLFHKTSHRDPYDEARADFPDDDDVLLWNSDRELTESTIANVVVQLDGELVTPPVDCGLLPGVFRAELLESGQIRERVVSLGGAAAGREDLPGEFGSALGRSGPRGNDPGAGNETPSERARRNF